MLAAPSLISLPQPLPAAAPAGLAVHERMVRRACGAASPAALLDCLASEAYPYVLQRWAWLGEADPAGEQVHVAAAWPRDDALAAALPPALPLGPGLGCLLGSGKPGLYAAGDCSGEPYDSALEALGVAAHVTLCAPAPHGRCRLVTLAAAESLSFAAGQEAAAAELLPAVAACLALGEGLSGPAAPQMWAGLDPVELVDYVCSAAAHDVRNILSGILGAMELRAEDQESAGDGLQQAVRRRVLEGVAMVDAMRDRLRRLAAPRPDVTDLGAVAAEVTNLLRPLAELPRWPSPPILSCTVRPTPVHADPHELRRALSALLFNAMRAAGNGGSVQVDCRVERHWALVEVTDDGPGLSEEVHRRAKEPFYTTLGGEHLGLGLTIADGVARRFGGSVVLRPAVGGGASATLRLPHAPCTG